MNTIYPFKRNFYYDVEKAIQKSNVTFILGARKCGKTVCMKQLNKALNNSLYFNLKEMLEDDIVDLTDKIKEDIEQNRDVVYLIDEATYFIFPEKAIATIASAMYDADNSNTKVVFAGSQSVALETWANRAFAGNAILIHPNFLSYPEWLAWKGMTEVSKETYNAFLFGTKEFYKDFISLDQYLTGCLEETILSNLKTSNVIPHNNCERLNAEILKNILYGALISQSDRPDIWTFFDKDVVFREIRGFMKNTFKAVGAENVRDRVDDIFSQRLHAYTSIDMETFRQALIFLHQCGLITLTYVSDETHQFENVVDVYRDLCLSDRNKIKNKETLFKEVNICIKYPMFYVEILKEILREHMPRELSGEILGGIIECHVRGLLSEQNHYEYHDSTTEHKVDYVNYAERKAIEISMRNKHGKELYFEDLPDDFDYILLTKDQHFREKSGLLRIPYYNFIYHYSVGCNLLNPTFAVPFKE